jgi:hypothetical protein
MNEAAETMFELGRSEVIGKPHAVLDAPILSREIDEVLASGVHCQAHSFWLAEDERHLNCRVAPYGEDSAHGAVVTIRDDTELFRHQEWADAILSSTGDGLIVFSPDNCLTYVNPAACHMLGIDCETILGSHTTMSGLLGLEPADSAQATPCWEMHDCDLTACPTHGSSDLRCWLVSGTLTFDGEPARFDEKLEGCMDCDVYHRNAKLLEEAGVHDVKELTLESPAHRIVRIESNPVVDSRGSYIGCVTTLRDVTIEREMAQMKTEFVSMVSHELRTPLTSIKGYVDLILDGEAGDVGEVQKEFLEIVKENSDRLVLLINDLLDISRIEAGRVHLKITPIDLADSIADAVGTFGAILDQGGFEMVVDVPQGIPRAAADDQNNRFSLHFGSWPRILRS